jgi:hypothetical protein
LLFSKQLQLAGKRARVSFTAWAVGPRGQSVMHARALDCNKDDVFLAGALCSAAIIISWMNKFYMDDVHWKLPQLFYFRYPRVILLVGGSILTKICQSGNLKKNAF